MKKKLLGLLLTGALSLGLMGCGGAPAKNDAQTTPEATPAGTEAAADATPATVADGDNVIRIGVTPKPHEEIIEFIKPILEAQGYTVEISEFNDYVLPNTAVEEGSLDVNFFQHTPYLEEQVASRGLHLVSVGGVHLEPMGVFSKKITDLKDLPDGVTVAVPNDPSNEARALKLLQAEGLIEVQDGELITAASVTKNDKNLKFTEVEAAAVPRAIDDVDIAVINGNYAIEAGFDLAKDALASEDKDSEAAKPYVNIVVVKEGNENLPKIQALYAALTSDETRDFINNTYNGAVIPAF